MYMAPSHAYSQDRCNLDDVIDNKLSVTASLSCLAKELKFQRMPSGAVVASTKECDQLIGDWATYTDAYGRVIVGAIPNGRDKPSEMTHDVGDFRDYFAGIKRGEEKVKLRVDEMPGHVHGGVYKEVTLPLVHGPDALLLFPETRDPNNKKHVLTPNSVINSGSDRAHNNMPPYIALYYCKKS